LIIDWSIEGENSPFNLPLHNGRKVIGWCFTHCDYMLYKGEEEYVLLRYGDQPNNKETVEDNGWYEVING